MILTIPRFDIHKFQETENVSETFIKVGEYTKYGDNDDETPSNTNAILRIKACISISVVLQLPTDWTDGQNVLSIGFSSFSILLASIVLLVFVKYQNTPAVKSTTKELCYVMFAGIILVNTTLLISTVTSNFITSDVKVLPAIGFTMIYAALLVKTNRVARLLVIPENKFVNMNLKYLSLKAQMAITAILIGVEILICWFAIKFNDPDPSMGGSDFILKKYYLNGTFFINIFAFVALLILLSTYYAIKTRNIPTNFNETKCIGFAMYATVITAAAFGLVYFASKQKILAMNLCASINSLTILIFLFSPKLYIIFWTPERNTKVFFSPVTSSMRSFMGNKSRPSARKSSICQCYSLENTAPQSVDDLKEQVRDSIAKVIKELDDILNKRSKTDGGHVGEGKMKKKLKKDHLETEDVLQKAHAEMLEKVKSCHIELNHVQKTYLRSLEDGTYQ
ncbi:metabotropic glutamate receptor 1-like [Planococcus citri]|uniref:metabotropic glutamate receptor 1-like n=1 Tax=Planococcus citri TaxID=170843 RepID=UPI0031F94AC6